MSELPEWLSSTLAADAAAGRAVLDAGIRPLRAGWRVAGPALAVTLSTDDNLGMAQLLASPPPPAGTVLVVGGSAYSRTACLGDLVARGLLAARVAAVVTDGLVRDSAEVAALGLPVWSRGVTPAASAKDGPARVGGTVSVAGVLVADGDVVVADDDGVVVWPAWQVVELLAAAARRRDADAARLAALSERPV